MVIFAIVDLLKTRPLRMESRDASESDALYNRRLKTFMISNTRKMQILKMIGVSRLFQPGSPELAIVRCLTSLPSVVTAKVARIHEQRKQ